MSDIKPLNRVTGLLIIEVRNSNPNGDPDTESDPRVVDSTGCGLISPVSFKRKVRDLVGDENSIVMDEAVSALGLKRDRFQILERRGRDRTEIGKLSADEFRARYWDARVFGNTFLESLEKVDRAKADHFIATGVVQFGPGVSVAPVEITRLTTTNKSGVEEGKDRGMAPLGWRVVQHGLYAMPFFVNPAIAKKTGCTREDIELLKFMIPLAYRCTLSAVRPFVEIRHAWLAEHKTPLGSCPDHLIIDGLMPRKKSDPDRASTTIDEYSIPSETSPEVSARLLSITDLCAVS